MNADPTSVTRTELKAAYDALGLDPDGWDMTYEIEIRAASVVIVRRYRRAAEGGGLASAGGHLVTETVEVAVNLRDQPVRDA